MRKSRLRSLWQKRRPTVTVTAQTDFSAHSILKALYGKGNIVCMPSRVPESVRTNEDAQAGTPEQQRVERMRDNAKAAQQKAKQLVERLAEKT